MPQRSDSTILDATKLSHTLIYALCRLMMMFNINPDLMVLHLQITVYDANELTSQINISTTSHSLLGLTFDIWIYICCCERCVALRESFSGVRSPQILGSGSLCQHFWCLFMLFVTSLQLSWHCSCYTVHLHAF